MLPRGLCTSPFLCLEFSFLRKMHDSLPQRVFRSQLKCALWERLTLWNIAKRSTASSLSWGRWNWILKSRSIEWAAERTGRMKGSLGLGIPFLLGSVCVSVCVCARMHVCAQSYLVLCDPMDCSWPGSPVHRVFQARILEWDAISYSRGYFWARDWTHITCVSCIVRWILYHCTTWQVPPGKQERPEYLRERDILTLIFHSG